MRPGPHCNRCTFPPYTGVSAVCSANCAPKQVFPTTPVRPCSHLPLLTSFPPAAAASKRLLRKIISYLATPLRLPPFLLSSPSHSISQICDSAQRIVVCLFQSSSRARSYPDQILPPLHQSSIHELPLYLSCSLGRGFRTSSTFETSYPPSTSFAVNLPPSHRQHVCYQRGEAH